MTVSAAPSSVPPAADAWGPTGELAEDRGQIFCMFTSDLPEYVGCSLKSVTWCSFQVLPVLLLTPDLISLLGSI